MHESLECAHDLCNCTINEAEMEGETYCSHTCRNAQEAEIEIDACPCGHPPCDSA